MSPVSKSVLLLLGGILAGCAVPRVGPDYQTPQAELPAVWTAQLPDASANAPDAAALARWWTQFDDPALDRLVGEALSQGLDVRLAQARVQQARASRQLAEAGLSPSVAASAGGTRSKTSQAVAAVPTRTLYDAGFDAS